MSSWRSNENNTLCLGGADAQPKASAEVVHAVQEGLQPRELQDSRAISSSYTSEGTHRPEWSCTPACGACLWRLSCRPSKKMPNRVELSAQRCRHPHSAEQGVALPCPPPSWRTYHCCTRTEWLPTPGGSPQRSCRRPQKSSCCTVSYAF